MPAVRKVPEMPRLLVTMSHDPQSCALTDPDRAQRARQAMTSLDSMAEERGVTVHAGYANVVEHRTYLDVQAPDVATVEQLLIDNRMFAQNSCRIEMVRPMPEVASLLEALV